MCDCESLCCSGCLAVSWFVLSKYELIRMNLRLEAAFLVQANYTLV